MGSMAQSTLIPYRLYLPELLEGQNPNRFSLFLGRFAISLSAALKQQFPSTADNDNGRGACMNFVLNWCSVCGNLVLQT